MTKAELIAKVQSKAGFIAVLRDEKQQFDLGVPTKEKRQLIIEAQNVDGGRTIRQVNYLLDTTTDTAYFEGTEPFSFQDTAKNPMLQVVDALMQYCKTTFLFYFLKTDRINPEEKFAEVTAYISDGANGLTRKDVIVYKKGTNPITHQEITN